MIIENGPYTVYTLTNTINGRMYVGVTRKTLQQRFRNGCGYKAQKLFYSDIVKYGWENFEPEVFADKLTEEEAFNAEKLLIRKLREQDPDLLYNRDAGGKYGKHCQDTKEIIREANIGRIITEEAKEKIRAARAKQVFSKESIAKATEKRRGQKMSPEFCKKLGERSSKAVKCLENGITFSSATLASKFMNVSLSGISQVCTGKIPHIKGLHFQYV